MTTDIHRTTETSVGYGFAYACWLRRFRTRIGAIDGRTFFILFRNVSRVS
jgi:hypothetical protein